MKEINCDADRFYSFTVLRDDSSDLIRSTTAKLPSQQANSKGLSDCRSDGTEANYLDEAFNAEAERPHKVWDSYTVALPGSNFGTNRILNAVIQGLLCVCLLLSCFISCCRGVHALASRTCLVLLSSLS